MSEITHQTLDKKQITKSVIIAFIIGTLLLFTAVLPAEYNIDPLGLGKITGFSKLYVPESAEDELTSSTPRKVLTIDKIGSGPEVPRPTEADAPVPASQFAPRTDEVEVVVPAGEGLEYKINMLKGGKLKYAWSTDKGDVYFDFHGEVKGNSSYFESYAIAYARNMAGSMTAPFEGPHGWYFKNSSGAEIKVKLKLIGDYHLKQN